MSKGNGAAVTVARIEAVEADVRDLRQLSLRELRAVRREVKAVMEICRDNGRAFDEVMRELRLRDAQEESANGV